jgi:hypothetical protein
MTAEGPDGGLFEIDNLLLEVPFRNDSLSSKELRFGKAEVFLASEVGEAEEDL